LKERFLEETQVSELVQHLHKTPQRIVLPTREAMHVVKINQIMYCETSGSYTTFYLSDGKKIIISKPLKNYESILQPLIFSGFISLILLIIIV
jgi:two-component system LytT family response regulator